MGGEADGSGGMDAPAVFWRRAAQPDDRNIMALSPPLVVEKGHVDRIVGTLGKTIRAEAARRYLVKQAATLAACSKAAPRANKLALYLY